MAAYTTWTSTRTTRPESGALLAAVKTATGDATAVVFTRGDGLWRGKKAAAWTAPQIAAVQGLIDTTPEATPQLTAQQAVDAWPLEYKALVLALIDALNVVRARLVPPLGAITPAQAIQAIRDKAGTL